MVPSIKMPSIAIVPSISSKNNFLSSNINITPNSLLIPRLLLFHIINYNMFFPKSNIHDYI